MSSYTGVLHRSLAELRHFDPMLFGVVKRLIIVQHYQQWNFVFGRGPETTRSHEQITIRLYIDCDFAASLQSQGCADRGAGAITNSGAAAGAEILVRFGEVP
jgi:hypothetical protein